MTPFCRPAEPLKTYRGGRKKDVHFYIIRAILFLGAGAGLLLVPYESNSGIFRQFSERYPNLTISVSTASVEKAISRCWKSFTIKAGKLIGEPKI